MSITTACPESCIPPGTIFSWPIPSLNIVKKLCLYLYVCILCIYSTIHDTYYYLLKYLYVYLNISTFRYMYIHKTSKELCIPLQISIQLTVVNSITLSIHNVSTRFVIIKSINSNNNVYRHFLRQPIRPRYISMPSTIPPTGTLS